MIVKDRQTWGWGSKLLVSCFFSWCFQCLGEIKKDYIPQPRFWDLKFCTYFGQIFRNLVFFISIYFIGEAPYNLQNKSCNVILQNLLCLKCNQHARNILNVKNKCFMVILLTKQILWPNTLGGGVLAFLEPCKSVLLSFHAIG